jgi:hypothetical protein
MLDADTISSPSNAGKPPGVPFAIQSSTAPLAGAIISLARWLEQTGVTACTAWRWRKKGWLKTVNICGRQYLTQKAIEEFTRRATAGEFAQPHKVPVRHRGEAL